MTKYRALTGMTLPVDDAEDARVRKLTADGATEIPDRKTYRVEAGHIARYMPEKSVAWLLEGGHIEAVEPAEEVSHGKN